MLSSPFPFPPPPPFSVDLAQRFLEALFERTPWACSPQHKRFAEDAPAALAVTHRLWDAMLIYGSKPKTRTLSMYVARMKVVAEHLPAGHPALEALHPRLQRMEALLKERGAFLNAQWRRSSQRTGREGTAPGAGVGGAPRR